MDDQLIMQDKNDANQKIGKTDDFTADVDYNIFTSYTEGGNAGGATGYE